MSDELAKRQERMIAIAEQIINDEKNKKTLSIKDIVQGILIVIISGAMVFFATQMNKIPNLEKTIQNLPFTSDAKLLNDTVIGIQQVSSKNDTRLRMLLLKLKEEGILDEGDINIVNNY